MNNFLLVFIALVQVNFKYIGRFTIAQNRFQADQVLGGLAENSVFYLIVVPRDHAHMIIYRHTRLLDNKYNFIQVNLVH